MTYFTQHTVHTYIANTKLHTDKVLNILHIRSIHNMHTTQTYIPRIRITSIQNIRTYIHNRHIITYKHTKHTCITYIHNKHTFLHTEHTHVRNITYIQNILNIRTYITSVILFLHTKLNVHIVHAYMA